MYMYIEILKKILNSNEELSLFFLKKILRNEFKLNYKYIICKMPMH